VLVRALCLRHLGIRLGADQVRAEIPLVGNLRYESNPIGPASGKGALTCLLMPLTGSTDPHVQLFHARVRRIDGRGIIIQGIEEVWRRKHRTDYPQALWCWPVDRDDLKPVPPDPIDVEEAAQDLLEAMRGR
jgi:hypothetical protein